VTSSQALANPFHHYVTLDEISSSLRWVRTSSTTHISLREIAWVDRWLSGSYVDNGWSTQPRYWSRRTHRDTRTSNGQGTMVGSGAAYFLQAPGPAQVVSERVPLTYLNIGVYKVPQGASFSLSSWHGTGGVAYTLNVNNGSLTSTQAGGSIY
jgi:hypothetical protein